MPHGSVNISSDGKVPFLDREDQLRRVQSQIGTLRSEPGHFQVLEVHGHGGMGKTRLLRRIQEVTEASAPPDHVLWIPLEAEAHATELGPLLLIRDALNLECLMFDTALVSHWRASGQRLQLELSGRLARSLAVQAFQTASATTGTPLPIAIALEIFDTLKRMKTRLSRYRQEEFEAIDELWQRPGEIRRLLPSYLGLDIARALGPGDEFVAFYDGYEKQRLETRINRAPWMRDLIATLGRGVHVISTRETLRWDDADGIGVVESLDVDRLPEIHSRELIRARLGTLEPPLEDRLVEASRRVPFFLEAVVDAYPVRSSSEPPVGLDMLPSSPDESVAHLLEHLTDSERKLAIALATVQVFDRDLFKCLIRGLNLQIDFLDFDELTKRFFVEEVAFGLHKTHDLLSDFVRGSEPAGIIRREALQVISEELPARCRDSEGADTRALLMMFGGVLAGWRSVESPPTRSIEALVDAGYVLYDAGYWNELGAVAIEVDVDDEHPATVVSEFFAALAARRTTEVERGLELFRQLEDRLGLLGRHAQSAELEVAYLTELAGNYKDARVEFAALEERQPAFDPSKRSHLRLRLYHADMQIMDGELTQGSRLLLETYEANHLSKLDWIELVRHRAHAFRFSFLFETAERLYLQARQAAIEIGSEPLEGKLWTNLAETYCWHDPERALEAAEHSIELNSRHANLIELAKCAAARGIALAKLGEFDPAEAAVNGAVLQAERVGYPAGIVFSIQATAVTHGLRGNADALAQAIVELDDAVEELGTYPHLRAAPAWLTRSEIAFAKSQAGVDWLEPAGLEARLRVCLSL